MKVSEVNVVPIRPKDGLVAFASCVIDDSLYLGSIAVHTRPSGEYRLVFPTKTIGDARVNVFNPINKSAGVVITEAVTKKCDEVFGKCDEEMNDDGHRDTNLQL